MPVNKEAIGKEYPAVEFEVEADRIRRYADAVGETSPIHQDPDAAREAGFRDVVAPPMFCVVYQFPAVAQPGVDPDVGMNLVALVHGGQEFEWSEPVCAGDVISTTPRVADIYEKDGKGFYVFETASVNQDGEPTVSGVWTNIVRGV
jgi:acyl dehydratase